MSSVCVAFAQWVWLVISVCGMASVSVTLVWDCVRGLFAVSGGDMYSLGAVWPQ